MNPRIIQHLLRSISKGAPSVIARFKKGRDYGTRGLGKGPVRGIYDAIKKGPMSRREFLGRSTKIGIESKDLAAISKTSMGLRNRQKRAHSWLLANEQKVKRFYNNPEKYSKSFKDLLKKQENISVYGTGEGWFGFPFVGKLEKRHDALRDLLSKKYGHESGSYTWINKTFPGAKNYAKGWSGRGISDYGLKSGTRGIEDAFGNRGKGILHFINDLKSEGRNSNPLLQAFREGLYGK